MGWLANRARRGLTNRAYDQVCLEVGSAGQGSAIFAVAFASAVYPDAKYGSEDWDQFNSLIPKAVVDPTAAGKIVESWVDRNEMSFSVCITRLFGCTADNLIQG